MSEDGRRIEFGDKGPYLFQVLDVEPEALLLDELDVCLLQFGELYLPIRLDVSMPIAEALTNVNQADMGPERAGMVPMEFRLDEVTELPLITGVADDSFQFGDVIYLDVRFGETEARLCFSVRTASAIGEILSQVS